MRRDQPSDDQESCPEQQMDDIVRQHVDVGAVGLNDRRDQCRGNETNDAKEQVDRAYDQAKHTRRGDCRGEAEVERDSASHEVNDVVDRGQMKSRQVVFEEPDDTCRDQNEPENFAKRWKGGRDS